MGVLNRLKQVVIRAPESEKAENLSKGYDRLQTAEPAKPTREEKRLMKEAAKYPILWYTQEYDVVVELGDHLQVDGVTYSKFMWKKRRGDFPWEAEPGAPHYDATPGWTWRERESVAAWLERYRHRKRDDE